MHYKKISYFENKSRVKDLKEFKKVIIKYFENLTRNSFDFDYDENTVARQTRSKINLMSNKVGRIIWESGISSSIIYTHPPMLGGQREEIDLVGNIFLLSQYRIRKETLIDVVEKAIGVYECDRTSSLIRTVNPLYWINRILTFIAGIPFELLISMGFKIDTDNPLLKILKFIFYLIPIVAAIIAIFQAFQLL